MANGDCSVLDVPPSLQHVGEPRGAVSAGGLGYSRHYAQRIRDLGRTSKDGWIKRLWNHMFGSSSTGAKKLTVKTEDGARGGNRRFSEHDHVDRSLPESTCHQGHVTEISSDSRKTQPGSSHSDVIIQRQTRSDCVT